MAAFAVAVLADVHFHDPQGDFGCAGVEVDGTRLAQDADDDQVLACAVEARAHLIASGDQHLHSLGGNYQGVRIVTPAEAAGLLQAM